MYHPEKNRQVDFYKGGGAEERDMIIDVAPNGDLPSHHHHLQQQQQMVLGDSSGGEDHEMKAPKKRAETWIQDETLNLISFRREVDGQFNTSKSNKHLWEQISAKMREKGYDRSATMCTDKWRNLLKEYKKAKHHDRSSASAKMSYYKELEDLLRDRNKNGQYKSPNSSKVDFYIQFSDRGLEDGNIPFASIEAGAPATVGIERSLEHDPLTIASADTVAANGVPPWNWREAPGNVGDNSASPHGERLISVKWGDDVKKIAIDGTAEAIELAIRFAFLIRTDKIIWLENENNAIQSLDKNMPLREYTLHIDQGKSIKLCVADESGRMVMRTEDITLYSSEEFRSFLTEHGFTGLKELNGFRLVRNLDDLQPGAVYQGAKVRFLVGS